MAAAEQVQAGNISLPAQLVSRLRNIHRLAIMNCWAVWEPAGLLCFVDFPDFIIFAEYWLQTGAGLPADINGDGVVDIYDLKLLADEWMCTCPYNWPLRLK